MNSFAAAMACQIMGAFVQRQAAGEDCCGLFWPDAELTTEYPAMHLRGWDAVDACLRDPDHPWLAPGNLHLLHSAAYRDGDVGEFWGHWNTYSLLRRPEGVRWGYLRFTVRFACREGAWRILTLNCLELMMLEPWSTEPCSGRIPAVPRPDELSAEDFLALRDLAGRFAQNGPLHAKELFARRDDAALEIPGLYPIAAQGWHEVMTSLETWETWERENGMYIYQMSVNAPVFEREDQNTVRGTALSMVYEVVGPAFGRRQEPYGLRRSFACLEFRFVREKDWRILSLRMIPLLRVKEEEYRFDPAHRQLMTERENRVYAPEATGIRSPEDCFEIESLMPLWTEGVKRPDLFSFAETCMDTRTVDPSMHFSFDYIGYPAVEQRCRELICKFADKNPELWSYPQFHSANTPVIEIAPDGKRATASWFDFGWGNIGVAMFYNADQKERKYFPGIGKYYHSLIKEDGRWKIYRFFWRPLMGSLPAWEFHTDRVGGWSAHHGTALWPRPFEPYRAEITEGETNCEQN